MLPSSKEGLLKQAALVGESTSVRLSLEVFPSGTIRLGSVLLLVGCNLDSLKYLIF
jgi:hypothetical protein